MYTISQIKKMDRYRYLNLIIAGDSLKGGAKPKESGTAQLSRVIGVPKTTIWNYIQCLYLEPETQAMIDTGEIPYTYALPVARLFLDYPDVATRSWRMVPGARSRHYDGKARRYAGKYRHYDGRC